MNVFQILLKQVVINVLRYIFQVFKLII